MYLGLFRAFFAFFELTIFESSSSFTSSVAFKKRPMGTRYSMSQCTRTQNGQNWFKAK